MANRFLRLIKIFTGTDSGGDNELLQIEGKLERTAHFWTLVARHFVRNRCLIRASALAYTTLLAIIPLLAVVISISTSLLKNVDEDKFYSAIASVAPAVSLPVKNNSTNLISNADTAINSTNSENFSDASISTNNLAAVSTSTNNVAPTTVQKQIAQELHGFVQNTQGTALGVTGMIVFVFIAIMMLSRIEETFNDIWGVARGRGWLTRVVLYWTAITLGPLLMLTAVSLAGGSQVQAVKDYFQQTPQLGNFLLKFLPLVVLWFAFALIYQIVPNTKVQFSAALTGGVIAGSLWHLNNVFGFIYVARVVQNSEIYGKIGLVPVFMLGLYFSWAILLFGAQVAYAYQNRAAYLQDRLADNVNQRGREFVAIRIMTLLGQRFQNGEKPASVIQIANELGVPSRLTQQILRTLANARLVTETGGAETGYAPARPLESINAHHILLALRAGSGRELILPEAPALAEIYGEFARIEEAERLAAKKISLLALAAHVPAKPALAAPPESKLEKRLTDTLVVEEISKPEQNEKASAPTIVSTTPDHSEPQPTPEISTEPPPARREVLQPQETEFPL
jgi:membrane protein